MKGKLVLLILFILPLFLFSQMQPQWCLDFDGNDYVTVPHHSSLDLTTTLTIEAWVRPAVNDFVNYDAIVQKQGLIGGPYSQDSYFFGFNEDDRLHMGSSGGNIQSTTTSWTIDQWYHVAGTYDYNGGSPTGDLYIDGQSETLSVDGYDTMAGSTNDLIVGYYASAAGTEYFEGMICGLRIWSDVRTQQEIQDNMYTVITSGDNLVSAWYYDPLDTTSFDDVTTNNNDGTLASSPNDPEWTEDCPLPIVLSTFTALFVDNAPTLYWTTQSETNNTGWNIYRSEIDDINNAIQINAELIPGAGTTSLPTDYTYIDELGFDEGATYYYWLESIDNSGENTIHGPVSIDIIIPEEEPVTPPVPDFYGLYQNYPNPFNPDTEISFIVKEDCVGELSVYNLKGAKINTIYEGDITGEQLHTYSWNGKDETGNDVTSGVYFYRLDTSNKNYVRKMVLTK
jgi:hypothetical protein